MSAQFTGNLEQDLKLLQQQLGPGNDIKIHRFDIAGGPKAALVYVEGLVDGLQLQINVLKRLKVDLVTGRPSRKWSVGDLEEAGRRWITVAEQRTVHEPPTVPELAFGGSALLLAHGAPAVLALNIRGWKERNIEVPTMEAGLRGPRDGFTETLTTNLALLRRRLQTRSLEIVELRLGKRSHTRVALVYLKDVAQPELVRDVRRKLEKINYDAIIEINQLREITTRQGYSPFPRAVLTERPDRVVASLLAGQVAVLTDTSPMTMIAPTLFWDFFKAPDDYYSNPLVVIILRLVRLAGAAAMSFFPSLYVALEQYNPELFRTDLALFLAGDRMNVPLLPVIEILFLAAMLEMIHEATARLPTRIGSAATIVGGLIIGEAAVRAKLISSVVIIVVAAATIGSYTLPNYEMSQAWRTINWLMITAAALFGIYGLFIASFCLLIYLSSLDSFGVPYLAPVAPPINRDLAADLLVRLPWPRTRRRPTVFRPTDPDRSSDEG